MEYGYEIVMSKRGFLWRFKKIIVPNNLLPPCVMTDC